MYSKKILFTLTLGASLINFSKESLGHRKPVFELSETPLGKYPTKISEIKLPNRKMLETPPVKNQDPLKTCTIFTATGLYETHNSSRRVSESEFAVYAETQIDDCAAGINLGYTLDLAKRDGFVLEKDSFSYETVYVPYTARINNIDSRNVNWEQELKDLKRQTICLWSADKRKAYNTTMMDIGVPLRLEGQYGQTPYRLGENYYLHLVSKSDLEATLHQDTVKKQKGSIGVPTHTDLHQIKLALAHNLPVAVAADVYDNCWSPGKRDNYIIRLPSAEDERQGSHAFMITGYHENYFRVRNSWGYSWADNGYAWLPGEYLERYATEVVAVER
jgi:hypothetical protein